MAAPTLPPAGGEHNPRPPVVVMLMVKPTLAAILVEPDHEFGTVRFSLAANQRITAELGAEAALQLAAELVGAVRALRG
jgi:hypothetical protein